MSEILKPPDDPPARSSREEQRLSEPDSVRLDRSPHPYHRRNISLKTSTAATGLPEPPRDRMVQTTASPLSPSPPSRSSDTDRSQLHEDDGRTRRRSLRTSSDSGTEADDERFAVARALPAPPTKPRKGLRQAREDAAGAGAGAWSPPLLTPSQLDEVGARAAGRGYFGRVAEGGTLQPVTDEEERAAREKYWKRRRAEILRRSTECALLGAIALIVACGDGAWQRVQRWRRELVIQVAVVVSLVALYPVRLLLYSWKRGKLSFRSVRHRILVPASFDPATLLYPVFLPTLVALSISKLSDKSLLSNVVLGLSAMPARAIPFSAKGNGYSPTHWLLSILPIIASENLSWPSKVHVQQPNILKSPPPPGVHPEVMASLFPLHQALLPTLHYLTTTSLLPAELHLLSVSLINIFMFSESPQMVILAILMWVGGLGLFLTCGKVLKWAVALARIPRIRFRNAAQIIRTRNTFLSLARNAVASRKGFEHKDIEESDSEPEGNSIKHTLNGWRLDSFSPTKIVHTAISSIVSDPGTMSAGETIMERARSVKLGVATNQTSMRKRSQTMPASTGGKLPSTKLQMQRTRRKSRQSYTQSFFELTPSQAKTRKWMYAGYAYVAMILLVMVPIRIAISRLALHGYEPFGWAIGYLFGDLPQLRTWVVDWDLQSWVALPPARPALDYDTSSDPSPLGEHLRTAVFGPANSRLLLSAYWLAIIALGMATVLRLTSVVEVDTRRKVFHGMMVAMLLPTIPADPPFVSFALLLVLAAFLVLDLVRASQLPPLSQPLARFLTPYVDGRDLRGPVVVSHIFLLVGCAIPLWLSLAAAGPGGGLPPWEGWDPPARRDPALFAGVVCVGMGDAAASLVGRRFGRRKWPWAGGKSLEGSAAFAVAVTAGLVAGKVWLALGGWDHGGGVGGWNGLVALGPTGIGVATTKAGIAAAGASLMEAVLTGGNDNVIVPVVLWLLVRGLQI